MHADKLLFLSDVHTLDGKDTRRKMLSIPGRLPAPEKGGRLVIAAGGDMIQGSSIHARQDAMQELSARAQADVAVEIWTLFLEKLLGRDEKLSIYWVAGNHGRTGKTNRIDDNWDLEIGQRLKELFRKEPIKFKVELHQPHSIFQLSQTRFYMIHRTAKSAVHLVTNARKGVVYERLLHHRCDVMLLGHHHQATCHGQQDGALRLVVNGFVRDGEVYYGEENGYWTKPAQALVLIPRRGTPTVDDVVWLRL